MLEHLIEKYQDKNINEVVYKLSYAGKYIIVKGKTMAGSMIIIEDTFEKYCRDILFENIDPKKYENHLYKRLYDHFYNAEGVGRFRVKTLGKVGRKIDQYRLLKREQMELDKARLDNRCLNVSEYAYIPLFNHKTHMFGWLTVGAVANFKRWLSSKERKSYLKRYSKTPNRVPAMSDLSN